MDRRVTMGVKDPPEDSNTSIENRKLDRLWPIATVPTRILALKFLSPNSCRPRTMTKGLVKHDNLTTLTRSHWHGLGSLNE